MISLKDIHNNVKIHNGDFTEEVEEQKMICSYLTGNEKVLELGSNIGRSSLVIAYILHNDNDLVTIEPNKELFDILKTNRDINNFNFQIETAAISNRQLIQKQPGELDLYESVCDKTFPSDEIIDDHQLADSITLNEFRKKYPINFDTLVVDCEGAFYYILSETPEILDGINLIIMENDYDSIEHKNFVDGILIDNGFKLEYNQDAGYYRATPCYDVFYQVWKK